MVSVVLSVLSSYLRISGREDGVATVAVKESLMAELLQLSPAERIQLAEDLWNSVALLPESMPGLTEEQVAECERRLAEHDRDPSTALPWQEVRARLWSRLG
jgi:putative addiction module component (TIGR02574 family)